VDRLPLVPGCLRGAGRELVPEQDAAVVGCGGQFPTLMSCP
jgi:hypothetical protein